MNFNEKLIDLRKSKGLSQEELGAELHVSRQTVSKWESAQSYPDFQRLVLLSDYFGLTLDAGSGRGCAGGPGEELEQRKAGLHLPGCE